MAQEAEFTVPRFPQSAALDVERVPALLPRARNGFLAMQVLGSERQSEKL